MSVCAVATHAPRPASDRWHCDPCGPRVPPRSPGVDFVVEMVSAPSYFGEIEVVDRLESRQHKVWVPPGEPAVMAAIPVNVFWRLLLSEVRARSCACVCVRARGRCTTD